MISKTDLIDAAEKLLRKGERPIDAARRVVRDHYKELSEADRISLVIKGVATIIMKDEHVRRRAPTERSHGVPPFIGAGKQSTIAIKRAENERLRVYVEALTSISWCTGKHTSNLYDLNLSELEKGITRSETEVVGWSKRAKWFKLATHECVTLKVDAVNELPTTSIIKLADAAVQAWKDNAA